eukprot:7512557-Lingulodinium_polyedra.AAC.1
MLASDDNAVASRVIQYAKVGLVLDRTGMYEMSKICEICKAYMLEQARAGIEQGQGQPALFSY